MVFPTPEEYARLLEENGLTVGDIALVPRPTRIATGMEGWLTTFGRSFFEQYPDSEHTEVLDDVIELLRPSLCDSDGH